MNVRSLLVRMVVSIARACGLLRFCFHKLAQYFAPFAGMGQEGIYVKGCSAALLEGRLGTDRPRFRASLRRCDAPARPVFSVTSTGCAQAESGHSGGAHAGAGGAGQRIEGARYAQCGDFAYLVLIAALQLRQAMLRAIYGCSASMVAAGFV